MPLKATEAAGNPRVIDRWDGGVGWIAHPDEGMQRASHAVEGADGAWAIDPVDAPGVDDIIGEVGDLAGVVVLLDRHTRDAARLANRHDVAVHVPAWMDEAAEDVDAPVERFRGELEDTGYRARHLVDSPFWREAGLVGADGRTLVVADALGTAEYFRVGDERLAVHPMLRLVPPRRALRDLSPERILVGHGDGVLEDGAAALEHALSTARRRAPRAYLGALASLLS